MHHFVTVVDTLSLPFSISGWHARDKSSVYDELRMKTVRLIIETSVYSWKSDWIQDYVRWVSVAFEMTPNNLKEALPYSAGLGETMELTLLWQYCFYISGGEVIKYLIKTCIIYNIVNCCCCFQHCPALLRFATPCESGTFLISTFESLN